VMINFSPNVGMQLPSSGQLQASWPVQGHVELKLQGSSHSANELANDFGQQVLASSMSQIAMRRRSISPSKKNCKQIEQLNQGDFCVLVQANHMYNSIYNLSRAVPSPPNPKQPFTCTGNPP
jgi:hypothetical protein